MIVEIGTSDFRTKAGQVDGLFIEPVKPYFDRLPDCRKENVAVSNRVGEVYVFYMLPEDIAELKLPDWARGCNSINAPHPTIQKLLTNRVGAGAMDQYIQKSLVRVERIKNLLTKHKIKKIDYLKIDTEGHDTVILNDYLETVDIKPKGIQFEANQLSKSNDIAKIVTKLKNKGYSVKRYKTDLIAEL